MKLDKSKRATGSLKTWLVDIEAIEGAEKTSNPIDFELARLIYENGGSVKPMILLEYAPGKYRCLAGFDVLIAVRWIYGQDDDFEMIRCYIVKNNEEATKLLSLFHISDEKTCSVIKEELPEKVDPNKFTYRELQNELKRFRSLGYLSPHFNISQSKIVLAKEYQRTKETYDMHQERFKKIQSEIKIKRTGMC